MAGFKTTVQISRDEVTVRKLAQLQFCCFRLSKKRLNKYNSCNVISRLTNAELFFIRND
jgi:hypothetical protein